MKELFLRRLPLGAIQTNCYLVGSADGPELVIIDPSGDADALLATIRESGRSVAAILLTHAHWDHVGALADVLERHPVPAYLHSGAVVQLERAAEAAARWAIPLRQPPVPEGRLDHLEELEAAGIRLRALLTPGHAPGHLAFHLPAHSLVFSGDALFRGSIGRTDLPMSDGPLLMRSIHEQLLTLPDDTVVLSGHGEPTTIAAEKSTNPFLRG